jgi:hypothetical protein
LPDEIANQIDIMHEKLFSDNNALMDLLFWGNIVSQCNKV